MGGNMDVLADWTRTLPYVNLVQQGRKWGTPDQPFDGNATYDPATGWPTCDFSMILAGLNLDLGGTYLFHAIGNASIANWEGTVKQTYDPSTNTLTANLTMTEGTDGIVIVLRNTTGPGLRNISLLQPGYNLSRASDFTDLFLAHLSRFKVLRFMDWTSTNNNLETDWNETTPVDWATYANYGKHNPWSTIPSIVNQFNTSTDVWINIGAVREERQPLGGRGRGSKKVTESGGGGVGGWTKSGATFCYIYVCDRINATICFSFFDSRCKSGAAHRGRGEAKVKGSQKVLKIGWRPSQTAIPHNASDDYIINLARLMLNELNPRSNIYTEFSNEVWNWEFPQYFANTAAANDSVHNHGDPYHFAYDNATSLSTWSYRRIAYQAKHISDLFKTVFGEENVGPFKRVRPILSCELLWTYFGVDVLDYLNINYGPPSNFLHGIAVAPYFTLGPYERTDNLTVDQVIEGFNISVQEMLPEQGWGQQQLLGVYAVYAAWYNLSVHAYEGGADTTWGCGTCSLPAKTNATRDSRLTDISVQHLQGWYRYGFEPYNWYSIGAGQTSQYGSYTLLEDMRQETRIDTTKMFNKTSPVAKLPRPSPKLKAVDIICDTPDSSITLTFGISLPANNFNATNYMNHPNYLPHPDLRNLTVNSTFFYPIQIFQSPIKLNLTVYVAGNASLLEAAINNDQFTRVETPQTFNTTTFQPTPIIQFNIKQTKVPSIVTLRLKTIETGYSIRSFDLIPVTTS